MKKITIIATIAAACIANAGVPVKFIVETSRADVQEVPCYHGETLDFEVAFKSYGQDLEIPTNDVASVFWQTNGMAAFYWRTNNVDIISNRMVATFTPEMDPGTASCKGFIGIPGNNYRASFVLRYKNSPGQEPKSMEWPYRELDFTKIAVKNAPYYLKSEADTEMDERDKAATNELAIALRKEIAAAKPRGYEMISNKAEQAYGHSLSKENPHEVNWNQINAVGWNWKAGSNYIREIFVGEEYEFGAMGEEGDEEYGDFIRIGKGSKSTWDSVVIGGRANGEGGENVAVGFDAIAEGEANVAVGNGAKVLNNGGNGVAVGSYAKTRDWGVAIGKSSEANDVSTAIGKEAKASGYQSVAVGEEAVASHLYSVAIGTEAVSKGDYTITLGRNGTRLKDIWLGSVKLQTETDERYVQRTLKINGIPLTNDVDLAEAATNGLIRAQAATNAAEAVYFSNVTNDVKNISAPIATNAACSVFKEIADYALTNLATAAYKLRSSEIGNYETTTNFTLTLQFTDNGRSGDCLLYVANKDTADHTIIPEPASSYTFVSADLEKALTLGKATTNLLMFTRVKADTVLISKTEVK